MNTYTTSDKCACNHEASRHAAQHPDLDATGYSPCSDEECACEVYQTGG